MRLPHCSWLFCVLGMEAWQWKKTATTLRRLTCTAHNSQWVLRSWHWKLGALLQVGAHHLMGFLCLSKSLVFPAVWGPFWIWAVAHREERLGVVSGKTTFVGVIWGTKRKRFFRTKLSLETWYSWATQPSICKDIEVYGRWNKHDWTLEDHKVFFTRTQC